MDKRITQEYKKEAARKRVEMLDKIAKLMLSGL